MVDLQDAAGKKAKHPLCSNALDMEALAQKVFRSDTEASQNPAPARLLGHIRNLVATISTIPTHKPLAENGSL